VAYKYVFSSTELSIVICTTAVYRRCTQRFAFRGQEKRATYLITNFVFKLMNALQKTARLPKPLVSFCLHFVNYFNFVSVVVLTFVFLFSFRSRSNPVPQRGERVKQRTVHARNSTHCYINCKRLYFDGNILCILYGYRSTEV
jgi:hypothetical protein